MSHIGLGGGVLRHGLVASGPKGLHGRIEVGPRQVQNALLGQRMMRWPSALRRTTGRTCVKSRNSSGSIAASGVAPSWRARARIAPVAASPASIHPPNATSIVGMLEGGGAVKFDLVHAHSLPRKVRHSSPCAARAGSRGSAGDEPGRVRHADVHYSTICRASTRAEALRIPHRFAPISCQEASEVEADAVPYALTSTSYKR